MSMVNKGLLDCPICRERMIGLEGNVADVNIYADSEDDDVDVDDDDVDDDVYDDVYQDDDVDQVDDVHMAGAGAGAGGDEDEGGIIDMYTIDQDGYRVDHIDDDSDDDVDHHHDEDYVDGSGNNIVEITRTISTRRSSLDDPFDNQMHILLAMHA